MRKDCSAKGLVQTYCGSYLTFLNSGNDEARQNDENMVSSAELMYYSKLWWQKWHEVQGVSSLPLLCLPQLLGGYPFNSVLQQLEDKGRGRVINKANLAMAVFYWALRANSILPSWAIWRELMPVGDRLCLKRFLTVGIEVIYYLQEWLTTIF